MPFQVRLQLVLFSETLQLKSRLSHILCSTENGHYLVANVAVEVWPPFEFAKRSPT